jgi:hypothetical protein
MSLRIRRGTESQRTGVTFDTGEILWTTDGQQLWVGDGVTQGGKPAVGLNVAGYGLTFNTSSKKLEVSGLTADDIAGGVNNKFFSTELAQDAVAPMFTGGTHTNISFQYDDTLGKINATVTLDGIGLTDIVSDTSPELGGSLNLNGNDILGNGNINIVGNISAFGLGTDLSLNSNDITGIGNISFTGNLTAIGTATLGNSISDGSLTIYNSNTSYAVLNSIAGADAAFLEMQVSRGTFSSPLAVGTGDLLSGLVFRAYNGTTFERSVAFAAEADGAVISGGIPGKFSILTTAADGLTVNLFEFNSAGTLNVPILQVGVFDTSVSDDRPTVKGMITFNDTTGFFEGYNGTAWVSLG